MSFSPYKDRYIELGSVPLRLSPRNPAPMCAGNGALPLFRPAAEQADLSAAPCQLLASILAECTENHLLSVVIASFSCYKSLNLRLRSCALLAPQSCPSQRPKGARPLLFAWFSRPHFLLRLPNAVRYPPSGIKNSFSPTASLTILRHGCGKMPRTCLLPSLMRALTRLCGSPISKMLLQIIRNKIDPDQSDVDLC